MEAGQARSTDANQDLEKILSVLDSKWKRAAVNALLGGYLKDDKIYDMSDISAGSSDNQIQYMDRDFNFLAHSFKEKDGYFYVIEMKEVKKAPKAYDVTVYKFDPVDNWIEEVFLKGFRSNNPLEAQKDAANLFREFRDCDDIEEQLDRHTIVGYESNRESIIAGRKSLIQPAGYHFLERALNRQLANPGEPVLVYYEPDEEVRDNHILLFRMPEEKFSIRNVVSGETSGDYIQVHDLWIHRPALSGFRLDEDAERPSRFSKRGDEKLYIDRGVINFGSFLVALGQEAITQVTGGLYLKEGSDAGFNPARYPIMQALDMMKNEL